MRKFFVAGFEDGNDESVTFDNIDIAARYAFEIGRHSFYEYDSRFGWDANPLCVWYLNQKEGGDGYDLFSMSWEEVLKRGHGCFCNRCDGKN